MWGRIHTIRQSLYQIIPEIARSRVLVRRRKRLCLWEKSSGLTLSHRSLQIRCQQLIGYTISSTGKDILSDDIHQCENALGFQGLLFSTSLGPPFRSSLAHAIYVYACFPTILHHGVTASGSIPKPSYLFCSRVFFSFQLLNLCSISGQRYGRKASIILLLRLGMMQCPGRPCHNQLRSVA